ELDKKVPRLFYPLPLVETHELGVPFVMVSDKFEPTPERNGIYAGALAGSGEATALNWGLLRQVPPLYKRLANLCAAERWQGAHNIARCGRPPVNKQWLDAGMLSSDVIVKM